MNAINKIKHNFPTLYEHKFVRYILVGGSTFVIDFCILFSFHELLNLSIPIATSTAYWVSVTYNFLLNRSWTFSGVEQKQLHKNAGAYLLLLAFNYLFTVLFVSFMSHFIYFAVAKAIAVGVQITWTYFIYKHYVFISKSDS